MFSATGRVLPTGTVTVRYSVRTSRDAITQMRLTGSGADVTRRGDDLRDFGSLYLSAPMAEGVYSYRVVASTAAGCEASSQLLSYRVQR